MKALRKKYGKRPWIDTPNAAWYRKRLAAVRFLNMATANMVAAAGYNQIQAIRSSRMDRTEKAIALAGAMINTNAAIAKAGRHYPMPDPNNP